MIYIIIFMGVTFLGVGYMVNERNADFLLSGYNTMSKEQQQAFDLKGYLGHFRKFHLFLGISFTVLGSLLYFVWGSDAAGVFVGVYPIAAYLFFLPISRRYFGNSKQIKISLVVMILSLVLVIGLFVVGFREDPLVVTSEGIYIKGIYSESLRKDEIESVTLTGKLPEISYRSNGFALRSIKKGYFKTKEGETVKLVLNALNSPYILITKADGKKVIYSGRGANEVVAAELKKRFPEIYQE